KFEVLIKLGCGSRPPSRESTRRGVVADHMGHAPDSGPFSQAAMHIHLFRGTGAKNVVCLAPMGGNTMRTRRVIIFATLLVFTLGSFVLSAQHPEPKKRIALVVGNDAYGGSNDNPKQLTKLINPVRDARAVAALLKQYGFNVIEGYDLDRDR